MPIKKLLFILILITIIITTVVLSNYNKNLNVSQITLEQTTQFVSPKILLNIHIENNQTPIKSITVTTQQNEKIITIDKQEFSNENKEFIKTISVSLKEAKLQDGSFKLTAKVESIPFIRFFKPNTTEQSWELVFDSKPPQINIHSPIAYIHKGGSTVFAYIVSKPIVLTGVEINEKYFPAFQQPNGMYYCFFPFSIEYTPSSFTPYVIAEDLAGNKTRIPLPIHPIQRTFKSDTLTISDAFLEKKMPSFEQNVPEATSQLDRYLKVNSTIRIANENKLIEISKRTAPTILWSGKFYSLPRAVNKASFGEKRDYIYNNQIIDQQIHMGLDLASVVHAPVPAANDGIVVFTNELGIFGNLIVIDHGLGLQTLYAHLSSFTVQENQPVKKGEIIGYTGKTGLAGGDHLHFGVTVGGIQVNPIDWLDPKWIKNNITNRLTVAIPNNKMPNK